MTLTALVRNNGEVNVLLRPSYAILNSAKALELHCKLAFRNLIFREHLRKRTLLFQQKISLFHTHRTDLQMRRQSNFGAKRDEPFGRVVLIPPDCVAIVGRELVMKVVISFPECDERGDQVVPWCMPVIERCLPEPVGERVERKYAVVHHAHPHGPRVDVPAPPVAPEIPRDGGGDGEAHDEDQPHVPPLLPAYDRALAEVAHVRDAGLAPRLDEHPADVAPPETEVRIVRIEVCVDVAVVSTVATCPPSNRALGGTSTSQCEKYLQGVRSIVRAMGPKAVISRGDAWNGKKKRS